AMAGLKRHHDGKIAGLYDLDKTLGRGHFAVVKLARHVFTGEKVAVKVIDKTKLDPMARGHLFQEVRCMKMVQHPNVLYLILELGDGGDMYDCIMKHEGGLSEEVAKCYFAQIVHAISYCHRLHVVHRDLKPENVVFFEKQGVVKLTDFGFSNRFQPGKTLNTSCGSLAYSAPEILLGDEYDAPAVDIWSLGVILFMLVCGQPPFQEANDSETLTMIMDCKYTVPPHISHACRDLIAQMLRRDPKKRATLEEIERSGWLQGVDPSPATKLSTPLVSHRSLSEEEHGSIIQRMVLGGIADRDAVTESLESNQYNHITATYFLLAERMLRERQEREQHQTRSPSPSKTQFRQSWPARVDVHQDVTDGLGGPAISHPGGPQSPARSAESLHKGPRPKTALLDLGQRQENLVPATNQERGPRAHPNPLRLACLAPAVRAQARVRPSRQRPGGESEADEPVPELPVPEPDWGRRGRQHRDRGSGGRSRAPRVEDVHGGLDGQPGQGLSPGWALEQGKPVPAAAPAGGCAGRPAAGGALHGHPEAGGAGPGPGEPPQHEEPRSAEAPERQDSVRQHPPEPQRGSALHPHPTQLLPGHLGLPSSSSSSSCPTLPSLSHHLRHLSFPTSAFCSHSAPVPMPLLHSQRRKVISMETACQVRQALLGD
ncbi:unnamed protein product, partial [Tetraodon nigroviridis]